MSIPIAISTAIHTARISPSPRSLPRKGTHSGTGAASVISPRPASRSRHTSSPAQSSVSMGMITQTVMGSVSGAVRKVRTYSVRGSSGVPWSCMCSGRIITAITAMGIVSTSPPRLFAIVRNESPAMASTWRARDRTPNVRGTRGAEIGLVATPPSAGVGACAWRRRPTKLHKGRTVRCSKRKRAYVNASVPSATPSHRRRLRSSEPSSSTSRVLFSIGVQFSVRSTMVRWAKASSSSATSRRSRKNITAKIPP